MKGGKAVATRRISVRKIKEILRLKWCNKLSNRQVAQNCNVSPPSTVSDLVQRATHANLSWPTVQELTDKDLNALLYVEIGIRKPDDVMPEWKVIHRELAQPNVTLKLLWWEYKEVHPNGFQYSQFCHHYRKWAMHLDVVMRQIHKAGGEKIFVDWAGQTVPIYNRYTGAVENAYLFVAVLGASNYTFAYLFSSMVLTNWVLGHCLAFEFLAVFPR